MTDVLNAKIVEELEKTKSEREANNIMLTKEERAEIINEILDCLEILGYFDYCKKKPQKGV